MSAVWTEALSRELPLAVVADGRSHDLARLLSGLHAQWGQPLSIWLGGENRDVSSWAAEHGLQVRDVDAGAVLSVQAPCLSGPLMLTAAAAEPGQLLFIGHGGLSREGILLGGLYALANLVPRHLRPRVCSDWNLLLLELYRRFGACPVMVPIRDGNDVQWIDGNPWAIDEWLLAQLPSRAGAFHAGVRRLLLPPSSIDDGSILRLALPRGGMSAYPCGLGQRILYRGWEMPRARAALVLEKLSTIIRFRARRWRGAA